MGRGPSLSQCRNAHIVWQEETRSVSVSRETVVQDALWTKGNNSNNGKQQQQR